jgi:FAD:protein FMN transferase
MPIVETLPVGADTAQWPAWGTTARIVLTETDPDLVERAAAVVRGEMADVEAACSRFLPTSELMLACRTGGRPVPVSPLLAELVGGRRPAARPTRGPRAPPVGAAMNSLGYDRDFAAVQYTRDLAFDLDFEQITGHRVAPSVRVFPTPDWRAVRLTGDRLTVPDGVLLDLGATAKACPADRAAARVAAELGAGVMVSLGGDIATAGPAPEGGWRVLVQDRPGDPGCVVRLPAGAALATSSTVSRAWGSLHHILDPRSGRPADRVWRTVSVAAFSCLRANTLSTAAIVRGHDAPALLGDVPARLVTPGRVVVLRGGWPA